MRAPWTACLLAGGIALAAIPAAAAPACMHPSQVPSLTVGKYEICWSEIPGASEYDAVVGLSLLALGTHGQSFAQANLSCLGATGGATCVAVPYDPPVGDGYYFVVRANRGNGAGSYETGCPTELPGRDAALDTAATCP